MDVSGRLRSVLAGLRREWREAVQSVQPSNQFAAQLLLGMISLHLEAREICKTNNLQKRKDLMNEFAAHKNTIEKVIQYLGNQSTENTKPEKDRAMSGLW